MPYSRINFFNKFNVHFLLNVDFCLCFIFTSERDVSIVSGINIFKYVSSYEPTEEQKRSKGSALFHDETMITYRTRLSLEL